MKIEFNRAEMFYNVSATHIQFELLKENQEWFLNIAQINGELTTISKFEIVNQQEVELAMQDKQLNDYNCFELACIETKSFIKYFKILSKNDIVWSLDFDLQKQEILSEIENVKMEKSNFNFVKYQAIIEKDLQDNFIQPSFTKDILKSVGNRDSFIQFCKKDNNLYQVSCNTKTYFADEDLRYNSFTYDKTWYDIIQVGTLQEKELGNYYVKTKLLEFYNANKSLNGLLKWYLQENEKGFLKYQAQYSNTTFIFGVCYNCNDTIEKFEKHNEEEKTDEQIKEYFIECEKAKEEQDKKYEIMRAEEEKKNKQKAEELFKQIKNGEAEKNTKQVIQLCFNNKEDWEQKILQTSCDISYDGYGCHKNTIFYQCDFLEIRKYNTFKNPQTYRQKKYKNKNEYRIYIFIDNVIDKYIELNGNIVDIDTIKQEINNLFNDIATKNNLVFHIDYNYGGISYNNYKTYLRDLIEKDNTSTQDNTQNDTIDLSKASRVDTKGFCDINIGVKVVKGKTMKNRQRYGFNYLLLKDNKYYNKNGRFIATIEELNNAGFTLETIQENNIKYCVKKYKLQDRAVVFYQEQQATDKQDNKVNVFVKGFIKKISSIKAISNLL